MFYAFRRNSFCGYKNAGNYLIGKIMVGQSVCGGYKRFEIIFVCTVFFTQAVYRISVALKKLKAYKTLCPAVCFNLFGKRQKLWYCVFYTACVNKRNIVAFLAQCNAFYCPHQLIQPFFAPCRCCRYRYPKLLWQLSYICFYVLLARFIHHIHAQHRFRCDFGYLQYKIQISFKTRRIADDNRNIGLFKAYMPAGYYFLRRMSA